MAAVAAAAAVPATAALPVALPIPWHEDYLTGELGFSAVAATCIESTQGYNGLDTLEDLTVKEYHGLLV
jgi:hypothetical protein